MTEREKMISGELYDSSDKELEQLRLNARKLARKYNLTDEDCAEEQTRILSMDVIRSLERAALLILILPV